jgi:hypothetical protein
MVEIVSKVPELSGRAAERAAAARACARQVQPFDPAEAEAYLDRLGLAGTAA